MPPFKSSAQCCPSYVIISIRLPLNGKGGEQADEE